MIVAPAAHKQLDPYDKQVKLENQLGDMVKSANIIINDGGKLPTTMDEIFRITNIKAKNQLHGLEAVPTDLDGKKVQYCIRDNVPYFVYYAPGHFQWILEEDSVGAAGYDSELLDSSFYPNLNDYQCVDR